jgi:hypothetical protein
MALKRWWPVRCATVGHTLIIPKQLPPPAAAVVVVAAAAAAAASTSDAATGTAATPTECEGERSQVEGCDRRWRGAIAGGGE